MPENITEQSAILPLPLGAQPAEAPPVPTTPDEAVEQWVAQNPTDFTETPPAVAPTPAPTPQGETTTPPPPATDVTAATTTPATGDGPQGETPAAVTTAPTPTQPKVEAPPVTQPTAPTRFDLNAKYEFVEGQPAWTGQQVFDALRDREYTLKPKAAEAESFRETFGMDAEQAKELWAPTIQWMRNNPHQVEMLASAIDDPQKAQYILDCSRYWDSPEGQSLRAKAAASAPAAPVAVHPDVQKRLDALEAQNKTLAAAEETRKKQFFTQRVAREMNTAFERYPFLKDNQALVNDLLATAQWLNGGDDSENSKGILDALEMKKALYDAKLVASQQPPMTAQPPPPPPPAMLGSTGAAPQTVRADSKPRTFPSADEAVDAWLESPPSEFR